MYVCEVKEGGKHYKVVLSDNESVIGIVEVNNNYTGKDKGYTVYNSDGVTLCKDLYVRKRMIKATKVQIERRLNKSSAIIE